ncbi:FAD/NAD P-binding domain-containing protein [Gloeophyllum trabeum ATCC 11539]|uniref:FAD/NAD P-binding domain-containing protein n=1 Tax=Gloeophyllum trabeum (strain ATCC 11539 / FP-39264 / Madison 617) TaxID=670483 RepID=S7RDB9_GLOTA|nr:FAD/NAD P-binding domain-containing protein [Gloeophyllum trabeum ATCC 11539]EPQ50424.1 FAD/NAD P-binding domain-containing protein [Gloeophyllum trabeum ATCC 11539]
MNNLNWSTLKSISTNISEPALTFDSVVVGAKESLRDERLSQALSAILRRLTVLALLCQAKEVSGPVTVVVVSSRRIMSLRPPIVPQRCGFGSPRAALNSRLISQINIDVLRYLLSAKRQKYEHVVELPDGLLLYVSLILQYGQERECMKRFQSLLSVIAWDEPVGGGPAGLVLAIALRRYGIHVRLIERRREFHMGARGTVSQPRTLEVFAFLGFIREVLDVATPPLRMAIHGARLDDPINMIDWAEIAEAAPDIPYSKPAPISQGILECILRKHLSLLGVEVETGTELISVEQCKHTALAHVHVTRDENVVAKSITCRYLIGADGAKGRTRKLLGISFLGETQESERLFTGNADIPGLDRNYWHRWGSFDSIASGYLSFFCKPLHPSPMFRIHAIGPELPDPVPTDPKGMQALFNRVSNRSDIEFTDVSWVTEWRTNIRMAEKFQVGRVFLVGGATPHIAILQQGGKDSILRLWTRYDLYISTVQRGKEIPMLLQFNLGWKLAYVLKGLARETLLQSYTSERLPVIAKMLNLTNSLHALEFNRPIDDASRARQDPMYRPKNLLQLGVNYRWSGIVLDERHPGFDPRNGIQGAYDATRGELTAGDRAPDARELQELGASLFTDTNTRGDTGGSVTLFEIFGRTAGKGMHVILVFPPLFTIPSLDAAQDIFEPYECTGQASAYYILLRASSMTLDPWRRGSGKIYVDSKGHAYSAYRHGVSDSDSVYVIVRPDGIAGAFLLNLEGVADYFELMIG